MQIDPTEALVQFIRDNCIDKLVDGYCKNFDELPTERFREPSMKSLAEMWKRSTSGDQQLLRMFMRLGAQNSIAILLGALDEDHSSEEFPYSLTKAGGHEEIARAGRDLLGVFWQQEEDAGQVNS